MSERMPAEIWIGGKIVDSAVPDLCAAIARERVLAEWGDGPFHPAIAEDLIEAVRPNGEQVPLLWLCDDQALWGEFASLERFLQEHQISFTRLSAGRYEYDPEMVTYRPGTGRVELVTNSSGAPVVLASRVAEAQAMLADMMDAMPIGTVETLLRSIRSARDSLRCILPPAIPPLEAFEIVSCTNLELACHGQ